MGKVSSPKEELAALLEAQGLQTSVGKFIQLVGEAVSHQREALGQETQGPLSPTEEELYRQGGFDLTPRFFPDGGPTERSFAEYTALIAGALTVGAAAARLEVDKSTIRRRLRRRELYGFHSGGRWRLPAFQFLGRGTLPGLKTAFKDLDTEIHPLSVHRFFMTPQRDLVARDGDDATTPRDWLQQGGSPEPVGRLLRYFYCT